MERAYESMMIVRDDITKEEREEVFKKITQRIESLKGKILDAQVWAQDRNFHFPIKGRGAGRKKYFKGCYWLTNFLLNTDSLPDLKETVRLEERILRTLYLNKEKNSKLAK